MSSGFVAVAALAAVCGSANASLTFTYDYSNNTPGVGFLDPVDGQARQAALTTAGNLFSNLFGSHFTNSATISLAVTSSVDANGSVLASAGSEFVQAAGTFGAGEVVRNKIIGGADLNGSALDGFVNVNWGKSWELNPNIPAVPPGPGQSFDLYAALFHEFTHALGFGSEISGTPGSDRFSRGAEGSGTQGSWSKWDQFLQSKAGLHLVDANSFEVNQAAFVDAQDNGGTFGGPNALAVYGGPVPLFANPDQSHLDEATFSTPNSPANFMMKPERDYGPQEARTYSPLEVAILTDLGYSTVPEPSALALAAVGFTALARRRRVRA